MPISRTRLAMAASPLLLLGPSLAAEPPDTRVFQLDRSATPPQVSHPLSTPITAGVGALTLRMDDEQAGEFAATGAASLPALDRLTGWPSRARNSAGVRSVELVLADTLIHDSNVLRLPGNAVVLPAGVSSKSDTINAATLGLRIDKEYAQQRIQLDIAGSAYRYSQLSYLNYDALEYRGAWQWRITPRWGGVLSADRRVSLASYADTALASRNQRNLNVTDNVQLTIDGTVHGGWHALLGVFQSQTKYAQAILPQNSNRVSGAEAGVKYVTAAGSALSLLRRSTQGDYLNRVPDAATVSDNAFHRNDTELRLDWNVSGKSAILGRIGKVDVRHENFAARNFSGLAGDITYAWSATDKLRIDLAARRELASWWQTTASYRIDDTLSLAPTWQISPKVSVRLRTERTQSDFLGPVVALTGPLRHDTAQSALLGIGWAPWPNVALDASLQRFKRSSNFAGLDYDSTVASVNARLRF